MKIEPGLIVVFVAMIGFYLRMMQIRGRNKRLAREAELARLRSRKKRKPGEKAPAGAQNQPNYRVASWWLVGGGAVLMLLGLALRTSSWFPAMILPYWWLVTTAGVVVFTFSIK
jgi:hypothetical protein